MADDVTITLNANSTPPGGTVIATDDVGGAHYQRMKLTLGADGAVDMDLDSGQQVMADSAPVAIASDQDSLSVDDGAGSLTVDNTVLSVVGGGAEATAQRITIADDSTGVLSVDDNAGSLTVDQATHDNLNANANIQVGDVDVAAGNPVPTEEQETPPDDASKFNPSFALSYTNGDLTQIVMTVGVNTYTRTLAYTNGDLTGMTVWS